MIFFFFYFLLNYFLKIYFHRLYIVFSLNPFSSFFFFLSSCPLHLPFTPDLSPERAWFWVRRTATAAKVTAKSPLLNDICFALSDCCHAFTRYRLFTLFILANKKNRLSRFVTACYYCNKE